MEENKNLQGTIAAFNTYHTDAYMIAVRNGCEGTEAEWLASLKGEKGDKGDQGIRGIQGKKGDTGKGAYEYAKDAGYGGTEAEYAEEVKNIPAATAEAYNAADRVNAYIETASEALESIRDIVSSGDEAPAIICEESGEVIAVSDASDRLLHGLRLCGKTTQNGTPSPDSPVDMVSVGDDGNIQTVVCGKNLLPNNATTQTVSGVTFTVNDDGSVTANGTATGSIFYKIGTVNLTVGMQYRLTGCASGGTNNTYKLYYKYGEGLYAYDFGDGTKFTAVDGFAANDVIINIYSGITLTKFVFYPMLRLASVGDDTYEPYKGQTLTAATPNGLPGIPVASGGNYTDENGQAWICDEIDFARGVYVRRIEQYTFTGEEVTQVYGSVNANGYGRMQILCGGAESAYISNDHRVPSCCDKYSPMSASELAYHVNPGGTGCYFAFITGRQMAFSTKSTTLETFKAEIAGTSVFYQLATPIETALSAEELAAFAALRTNKPNTTVYTDSNAGIGLEYQADTKTYIDNKFTALAAAIVNNA